MKLTAAPLPQPAESQQVWARSSTQSHLILLVTPAIKGTSAARWEGPGGKTKSLNAYSKTYFSDLVCKKKIIFKKPKLYRIVVKTRHYPNILFVTCCDNS